MPIQLFIAKGISLLIWIIGIEYFYEFCVRNVHVPLCIFCSRCRVGTAPSWSMGPRVGLNPGPILVLHSERFDERIMVKAQ